MAIIRISRTSVLIESEKYFKFIKNCGEIEVNHYHKSRLVSSNNLTMIDRKSNITIDRAKVVYKGHDEKKILHSGIILGTGRSHSTKTGTYQTIISGYS